MIHNSPVSAMDVFFSLSFTAKIQRSKLGALRPLEEASWQSPENSLR